MLRRPSGQEPREIPLDTIVLSIVPTTLLIIVMWFLPFELAPPAEELSGLEYGTETGYDPAPTIAGAVIGMSLALGASGRIAWLLHDYARRVCRTRILVRPVQTARSHG